MLQDAQYVEVPVSTSVTADLHIVPACALTWDDLVGIAANVFVGDDYASSFSQIGGEMVATRRVVHSVVDDDDPAAPPWCGLGPLKIGKGYTIDVWVDRSDLSKFGTRNYQDLGTLTGCYL